MTCSQRLLFQQCVPAELCSCICVYPPEGPSTDRCVLVGRECKKPATHSTRQVFSLTFLPILLLGFTVLSSVKRAYRELMLLFEAIVMETDLESSLANPWNHCLRVQQQLKKANKILDISRKDIENKRDINILPCYKTSVHPHLQGCVHLGWVSPWTETPQTLWTMCVSAWYPSC